MLRSLVSCLSVAALGCAATPSRAPSYHYATSDAAPAPAAPAPAAPSPTDFGFAPAVERSGAGLAPAPATPGSPDWELRPADLSRSATEAPTRPPVRSEERAGDMFTLKGGYFNAEESSLGDGGAITAAWTRYLVRILAVELEIGYLETDGDVADVWALPILLNGRVGLPITIFEIYGGLGIGYFYWDGSAGSLDDSGWVFGGQAFIGGNVTLGGIVVGLEGKYLSTEDLGDGDANLDGAGVFLTVGFR